MSQPIKNRTPVTENRRARFDYAVESTIEAGIALTGSEVKSLRRGGSSISESYGSVENGELWLINAHVAPYAEASALSMHDDRRKRKLLVSKRELSKLWEATKRAGMTIVPLRMYFNEKGRVKVLIGLAKGKNAADKRETSAKRDWDREKSRLLKESSR